MRIVHSPGPWEIGTLSLEELAIVSAKAGGEERLVVWTGPNEDGKSRIACTLGNSITALANARLIAVAPDLLEAHTENARILRLLWSELQGRVDAGKLAALDACLQRCDYAIDLANG